MLKILAWGVGGLVAVTLAIVALVPDFEVSISETEVREKIEDALPIVYDQSDIAFRLTDAKVNFIGAGEKGQVALNGELHVSGFAMAVKGTVDTVTAIRYNDGAFYLSDVQLGDLVLEPTLATRAKLAALKKAWQPIIDEFLEEIRKEEGGDEALQTLGDEIEKSLGPAVRSALDDALKNIPVYRLRGDAAQGAARLILKDIKFNRDEAIAVLSPAQAMIKISSAVIGGLILLLLGWEWYRLDQRQRSLPES